MRRILIAVVMCGAVAVVAPTLAVAAHHRAHHHHARHHRSTRRHSQVRHASFVRQDGGQPSSSGQAGTVSMFTDNGDGTGVLTITLSDGTTTVTGNVTNDTELECMASNTSQQGGDTSGDGSGDSNSSGGGDQGSSGSSGDSGDTGDNQGDGGDGQGDNGAQMCSTSSLTPGTPVAEANLEITSSGAVWNKIVLITS